mmetsp:Transcript_272/g.314  ORF Transcript_272/g.314 Transcript_272/m.314 type:complete len:203 (-) Transcript_272:938-1546(-)
MAASQFVDFVDQDERVAALCALQTLHHFPRHGANVRTAVAFDLGHVGQAANGKPKVLAVQRRRNALADARLADTRGADQAEDLALTLSALELAYGHELKDPLLHILEAVVVRVQHLLCVIQIEFLRRRNAPGKRRKPLQVRTRHVEFGGAGLKSRQLFELRRNRTTDLFRSGNRTLTPLLVEALDQGAFVVFFQPQLLLDAL